MADIKRERDIDIEEEEEEGIICVFIKVNFRLFSSRINKTSMLAV